MVPGAAIETVSGDQKESFPTMTTGTITPHDHAEQVALFRSQVLGPLLSRDLDHGALQAGLRELSRATHRPPGSVVSRHFAVRTLERWLHAYRREGLVALRPAPRRDRGRARALTEAQRTLLLEIRREHPSASVPLILRTLVLDGRLASGEISAATLRRLYREQHLERVTERDAESPRVRLRWQAERPGALWHADVCHGPALVVGAVSKPVRIHALLDDASRFIVAIEAHHTEREVDMLGVWIRAVRRHGRPDALYLDNGSTYRGETLALATARVGCTLLHARPHDPQARGKMERFWRTLREGLLDHMGQLGSLHDLNVRLWAYVDEHYHRAPHAGLMGRAPAAVHVATSSAAEVLDEKALRDSLTVRVRRRVRRDSTVPVDGHDWQLDQTYLGGRLVHVVRTLAAPEEPPWVEYEGQRLVLRPVDPVKNGRTRRTEVEVTARGRTVDFDPAEALLDRAVGRKPRHARDGRKGGAR